MNMLFLAVLATLALLGCSNDRSDRKETARTPQTRIVNLKEEEYDSYIGRRSIPRVHMLTEGVRPGEEGWLGNPHPIGRCEICDAEHSREECIEKFKADFYARLARDPEFKEAVLGLRGNRLGCYCKPLDCHGDAIKEYIDAQG